MHAHVVDVVVGVRDFFLRMCVYVQLVVGERETIDLNLSLELTLVELDLIDRPNSLF